MKKIVDIYNETTEIEWTRLTKSAYNQLEFLVFMHHLRNHLPETGLILDAGGGPGRYAIEFCRMGYEVVLLDIASACLDMAKEKLALEPPEVQQRLRQSVLGDVIDLSQFQDEEFDAVVCLDPLSCLAEESDRAQAMKELARVAKGGAVLALAVRGYLDLIRTILRIASAELTGDTLAVLRDTGNANAWGVMHHFFRTQEIKTLAESQGITTILMAGGEGLSSGMPEATEAIAGDKKKWDAWVETVIEYSIDPAVVDTSGHMLYLGQKG